MAPDQRARDAPLRTAGTQLERGPLADQFAPQVVVPGTEQSAHRHVDKVRIAVPSFAVGKGELGALDNDMDKLGTERIEIVEVEPLQQRQLLQEHRPLAPRPALGYGIAAVVEGERRL